MLERKKKSFGFSNAIPLPPTRMRNWTLRCELFDGVGIKIDLSSVAVPFYMHDPTYVCMYV